MKDSKATAIINAVLIIFLIVVIIWLCRVFSVSLMPFFTAIIIAYLLNPFVTGITSRKVKRGVAVSIVLLSIVALIIILITLFIPALIDSAAKMIKALPGMMTDIQMQISSLTDKISTVTGSPIAGTDSVNNAMSNLNNFLHTQLTNITNGLVASTGQWINLVIVPIVIVLVLLNMDRIRAGLLYNVPSDSQTVFKKMGFDVDRVIGGFVRGQTIMSLIAGVATGLCAYALGVPYVPIIMVVTAMTTLVPYFGPVVGGIVTCMLAFFAGLKVVIIMLVLFGIIQVLCGNLLAPALMADNVGLHPIVIMISVVCFGQILGGIGMLIAVPLVGTIRVLIQYLIRAAAEPVPISNRLIEEEEAREAFGAGTVHSTVKPPAIEETKKN